MNFVQNQNTRCSHYVQLINHSLTHSINQSTNYQAYTEPRQPCNKKSKQNETLEQKYLLTRQSLCELSTGVPSVTVTFEYMTFKIPTCFFEHISHRLSTQLHLRCKFGKISTNGLPDIVFTNFYYMNKDTQTARKQNAFYS